MVSTFLDETLARTITDVVQELIVNNDPDKIRIIFDEIFNNYVIEHLGFTGLDFNYVDKNENQHNNIITNPSEEVDLHLKNKNILDDWSEIYQFFLIQLSKINQNQKERLWFKVI